MTAAIASNSLMRSLAARSASIDTLRADRVGAYGGFHPAGISPCMDRIAREGAGGRLKTVPGGLVPSSDVANLSLLGYNPARHYSGRGPLEAASLAAAEGDLGSRAEVDLGDRSGQRGPPGLSRRASPR